MPRWSRGEERGHNFYYHPYNIFSTSYGFLIWPELILFKVFAAARKRTGLNNPVTAGKCALKGHKRSLFSPI